MKNFFQKTLTGYIFLALTTLVLLSCGQQKADGGSSSHVMKADSGISSNNNLTDPSKVSSVPIMQSSTNNVDDAGDWLKSLFKCKSENKFCFYLDTEEAACTKRFYQFMSDSEELFGASNITEEEYPNAFKKYKKKWSKIYPLRTEIEPWLFGRGQDDMENIREVKITKISNLYYSVFVDYNADLKTKSNVRLVEGENSYKIDYSETEFLTP